MRVRALLVPLVMAAALLGGCATSTTSEPTSTPTPTSNGVEALSADEILSKATAALKAASSFRVKGSADEDGTKVAVDMVVAGKDAKGSLTGDGMTVEILQVGGATYLKADELWSMFLGAAIKDKAQLDLALGLLKGKYVKVPANDESLKNFTFNVDDILKPEGAVTKGEATTIDGKPVITLTDASGNKMYIATTGEPYPVRMESKAGDKVDIVDIGAGATIATPGASEVIDFDALSKQFGS